VVFGASSHRCFGGSSGSTTMLLPERPFSGTLLPSLEEARVPHAHGRSTDGSRGAVEEASSTSEK
jgi:hypothetical protein